jgi:hypothetical protein
MTERFSVDTCDCRGECGYGPNILVNDRIFNHMRDRAAIVHALELDVLGQPPQESEKASHNSMITSTVS